MTTQTDSKAKPSRLMAIWRAASIPLAAVILALLVGAVILLISGANPIAAYSALAKGAFGSTAAFGRTLEKATPLILGGLAVAFAFKGGLFNIGGQGQLLFGAIVAAGVGFGIDGLPFIIHMPLALLIGSLAGALYGAIPGALKTYTGAHEVITTIMLNFIAINFTDWLADGPWKDEGIVARTPAIAEAAAIPTWGNIPAGFFLAILAAVATWYLLYRTTTGYEIRTVGLNSNAAKYAGIKVSYTVILTMAISGFLAGMGGAIETLGVVGRYQPGFNAGLGFDGITIALLARSNPVWTIPAAFLVGILRTGAAGLQFATGIAPEIVDLILAITLLLVSIPVLGRWIFRSRADKVQAAATSWGN